VSHFTIEETEKMKIFSQKIYNTLIEQLVSFFESNKHKLVEFVKEFNLKDIVLALYDRTLSVCSEGKNKAVKIYDNGKTYSYEQLDNLVKNEYIEAVKERINKLVRCAYDYVQMKS